MKIKSFATYGVGMDIIYEDILSTGAIADLRIKSEDEKVLNYMMRGKEWKLEY